MGKQYTIKKADASKAAVQVAAYGSQQIDGSSTQSLTASYARLTVVCDGSAWQVIRICGRLVTRSANLVDGTRKDQLGVGQTGSMTLDMP